MKTNKIIIATHNRDKLSEMKQKLDFYHNSSNRDDQQTFLFMERAYNFAKQHRALGLGVLGWHSLLQSKMLSFNSQEAFNLNHFMNVEKKYLLRKNLIKLLKI